MLIWSIVIHKAQAMVAAQGKAAGSWQDITGFTEHKGAADTSAAAAEVIQMPGQHSFMGHKSVLMHTQK